MLGSWLGNLILYSAFENEKLISIIEFSIGSCNNRLRISNLLVFERNRGKNVETKLIETAKKYAVSVGARSLVLETQSCKEIAIGCYLNNGFELIGLDVKNYTNKDIDKKKVRFEFGCIL